MPEENRPPRPVLAGRHSCAPRKSQVYHHGVHHLFRRVRQGFRPQGVQVCQAVRAMRRDSFLLLLCVFPSSGDDPGPRVASNRATDALVSRPRDPWIAIAGRVIVGTRYERRDGVGRHARCAGRTKEFFDAHRAWYTERRRAASTLGVHGPWGSYRGSLAIEDRSGRYAFGETDRA